MGEGVDIASRVLSEHPALWAAQRALKSELLEKKERLIEKVREKNTLLKKAVLKREEVGVKLYGLQKTLASIHIAVTNTDDVLATRIEEHEKAKEDLLGAQSVFKERRSEMEALQEKLERSHVDLDELATTLKQIESYNETIKSDIAANRRATYATEEIIVKAEKVKKDQDFYITVQQEQVKRYYQKQALCRAQLEAQQRESKMAVAALSEFGIEMDSINSEKKQLTDQWKSALIVLGRCDEALQALVDASHQQKEQDLAVQGEKHRYKKEIRLELEKADAKFAILKKHGTQMKAVQKRMNRVIKKRNTVLESYAKLLLHLEQTERSEQQVKAEREAIEQEYKLIEKAYLKQCQAINDLETRMLIGLSEQITLERSAQQVVQGTLDLRHKVRHEHMMATEIEYELARIRVDTLTVESYNQTIGDTLTSLDDEVKQKTSLISKMQAETRQKHSEIDMKTKEIDKLNKQYDKLTANLVDKSATPFENIITNIRYEISLKVRKSCDLQKQWLVIQTELVGITTENHALAQKARKLEKDRVSLEQRKLRLEKDLTTLNKYIKDINKNVQFKHNVISRLNEMIARNASMKEILAKDNLLIKNTNQCALKEMEEEAVKIEFLKEDCNLEKYDVSREVTELQNHIILWKRKINFEKETQAALLQAIMSPSAMLGAMKKEYERLKWELNSLHLQKEKLVADVQMRVMNRKSIAIKVQASNSKKDVVDEPNSPEALLAKSCVELKKSIREVNSHSAAADNRIKELRDRCDGVNGKLREMDYSISHIRREQEEFRMRVAGAKPTKSSSVLATALHHRMVKRHQDVKSNKWKIGLRVDLETDWSECRRKNEVLAELIQSFEFELPFLQPKFETMLVQLRLSLQI